MKHTFEKNKLGSGIYTIPDISFLLNYSQSKVRRYINDFWDERLGKKLFDQTYSWSHQKTKAVNFYVLIELSVFFKLQDLGVKTHKILKSREAIARDLNIAFPFASQGLLTDGQKIWYEFEDSIINADGTRQLNLSNFIKGFCEKIDFNNQELAQRYFPIGKDKCVVVDPHHQFGQPVISGTNINTEVLYSMYDSGEKISTLGLLYDISEKEIMDVIQFYNKTAA